MSEKLYKVGFEVEFSGHKYVRATNIEEARQKLHDEFVKEDGAIKMPLPFTTPLSDSFVITDATLQE